MTTMPLAFRFSLLQRMAMAATLLLVMGIACAQPTESSKTATPKVPSSTQSSGWEVATFAGGCFWCMESPFDKLDGVISTTSGYTGGHVAKPTYEQVSAGSTGHAEAIQIEYDSTKISYAKLLDAFWHNVDPVAVNRQFCDAGFQYRSAIFYHGEEQRRAAEESKRKLTESGRFNQPIATEIVAASTFYPAEDYHQDYYLKNPVRYRYYRYRCGRDARLQAIWGDAAKH